MTSEWTVFNHVRWQKLAYFTEDAFYYTSAKIMNMIKDVNGTCYIDPLKLCMLEYDCAYI